MLSCIPSRQHENPSEDTWRKPSRRTVKPRRGGECHEELAAICVWASICLEKQLILERPSSSASSALAVAYHGDNASASVLELLSDLIIELPTIAIDQ